MVKFVARQRCLCKLHVRRASQQAPPSLRGRNTSISASPIPIGPAVRTLFAKKAKNEDCANRHVPMCHRSIPNRHHHLPEVETHRSVPLPIAIGLAVRTLFAKKLKIKIVPIAIGMCQVPPIACQLAVIFPMSKHINYCLSQSDRTSRSDGIREKAKNKVCQSSCAKCHQSILNGHRHLPEVESHRLVPLPFRSDQPFGRYS